MLRSQNVAGGSQERNGKGVENREGDWYLVFSNVGETWNSATEEEKTFWVRHFRARWHGQLFVTCSPAGGPRFCLCPKGFVTTARWLLCTEEALLLLEIWWAIHFNTKKTVTLISMFWSIIIQRKNKKRLNSKAWQSFFPLYHRKMVSVQKPWNSIPGFKWERSSDGIPGWRLLHSFKRDLVGAGTLPGQGCVPSACVLLMTCCPHPYSLSAG